MVAKDIHVATDHLAARLALRQVQGSWEVASETVLLLRQAVSTARWNTVDQLIAIIQSIGRKLIKAQPRELTCGNIVRRVLQIIRDEHENLHPEEKSSDGDIYSIFSTPSAQVLNAERLSDEEAESEEEEPGGDIRQAIIVGINEIVDELESASLNISEKAIEQVHSNEIILTHGSSQTVSAFLRAAARKRTFTLIIVESFPNGVQAAHDMARSIAQAAPSIQVVVVPDSAVFAVMSRVNKVILGAHAILANGGIVGSAGISIVAKTATMAGVPVVVVGGVYKLCMQYPYDIEELIEIAGPDQVISSHQDDFEAVDVLNPLMDYAPPEAIELYITNLGSYPRSFLYKLISEQYDARDLSF